MEVSGYLVGSPAFKAGGTGDPRPAGSIPVHLRHLCAASASKCPAYGLVTARSNITLAAVPTLRPMKKLLLLLVLGGLLAVAAKKLRTA